MIKPLPCGIKLYNHNYEYYIVLNFFVIDLKIERENPHECDVCGQTFDKSSRLKEHVFTHTRVEPYECHLCDEKFSFTDTLARVCDFEATTKSRLRVHVQSKHGGIRFECTQCNSTFTRKFFLSKHVKTIHMIIQCDVDGNPCHAESSNYNHNCEYYLNSFRDRPM